MTSPIDISPNQLEIVCNILYKYLPSNVRVWVFGSRAKWTTHDGSDLDLAVEGDHPMDRTAMINLNIAFADSDLPYTVDVVDLKTINNKFKEIINVQKIPLEINNTTWHEMPVSEVATAIIGGTPSRLVSDYWHGNIPWVTAKDIAKNDSRYLYKSQESITDVGLTKSSAKIMPKNTILITSRGTVGALTQLGKEMAFNQTCYALVPNEYVDMDYLYYALKNTRSQMATLTYGTIFQTITTKSFKEWYIPIPPLNKQRIISSILGTLDAKIDLNRKMNQVLEDIARTLFKSWFVDFDPVQAKMNGRWKSGESILGLPANFYDLFPNQLINSDLKHIPKGWTIKSIGDIARILGGTTPSTKIDAYWKRGIHCWVTPKDLSTLHSSVLLNTKRRITDAGLQQISSGLLPSGTVLLSSRAPIGYTAITEIPVAINQGFIAMLPNTGISSHFLHRWCEIFHNKIINYANGSTFLEINKSNFRKIPIVTPSTHIMSVYHKLVSILHRKIVINERSLSNLIAQRDVLMPHLISGKLRIFKPHHGNDV